MGWDKYQNEKGQRKLNERRQHRSAGAKAKDRARRAAYNHMERQTDKRVASGSTWSAITAPGIFIGSGGIGGSYVAFGLKPMFLVTLAIIAVVLILAYCIAVSRKPQS